MYEIDIDNRLNPSWWAVPTLRLRLIGSGALRYR